MASALDSKASGQGSGPGRGHCVVFLGTTLYCQGATQVYKWVQVSSMLRVALRWTSIPSRGGEGIEILLVASCYRNLDKLWPNGPLGLASRLYQLYGKCGLVIR